MGYLAASLWACLALYFFLSSLTGGFSAFWNWFAAVPTFWAVTVTILALGGSLLLLIALECVLWVLLAHLGRKLLDRFNID